MYYPESKLLRKLRLKFTINGKEAQHYLSENYRWASCVIDDNLNLWITGGIDLCTRSISIPDIFIVDIRS